MYTDCCVCCEDTACVEVVSCHRAADVEVTPVNSPSSSSDHQEEQEHNTANTHTVNITFHMIVMSLLSFQSKLCVLEYLCEDLCEFRPAE